mgnify:CR=1 FL=1
MKTIRTDYGNLSVYRNKMVFSIPWKSKLLGYLILLGMGLPVLFMAKAGFAFNDWLRLLKDGWFFILPLFFIMTKYIGGYRDSLVINRKTRTISASRHFLFLPYKNQKYKFDQVKSISHYDVEYEGKRTGNYFKSVLKLNFKNGNAVNAASITGMELSETKNIVGQIILLLKNFTQNNAIIFEGKKLVRDATIKRDKLEIENRNQL